MLPTDNVYGGWPRSGEIDIVEVRGNDDLTCNNAKLGNSHMGSTLHFGPSFRQNMYHKTSWSKYRVIIPLDSSHRNDLFLLRFFRTLHSGTFSSDFHIYALEWLPTGITFKVDGEVIGSVSPPDGGFWEFSGLSGDNPWASGTNMAPFDQRVQSKG